MFKRAIFLMLFATVCSAQAASPNCDAALIQDTGSAWSTSNQDWRLAQFVSQGTYETFKHDAGANATIYGIPMGASYSDFQNNVRTLVSQTQQSFSASQAQNVAWTMLNPASSPNYQHCIDTWLASQIGLHAAVIAATATDVTVRVVWNNPGAGPAKVNWSPALEGLVQNIPQGTINLRLLRPKQELALVGNFEGFATEPVTLTPLPSAPPPETFLAKLFAHSGKIRINFVRGGVGQPKPANIYWRIATYVASKVGTSASVTGWYPLPCFTETKNTCAPGQFGNFEGRNGIWDEANRTISIDGNILNYDIVGNVSDASGPAGYISFDP